MTPDLLSRSLKLLRQHQFLIWLGLGMSLSSLFGTGWRLWLTQIFTLDFSQLTNLQSVESLLFSSEIAQMQQLLLRGLLLGFGQFVLVWVVALAAEAGLITAVSQHNLQPVSFRQTLRWGQRHLRNFFAVDLLVFLPWFLIALAMLLVILILAVLLANFATNGAEAGTVLVTTGLGLTWVLGLAGLLIPVGIVSLWYRLLAFRELIVQNVTPRTAVRQVWARVRANLGDVFVLIVILWGGQSILFSALSFVSSPLLTWLTPLTASDRIALQVTSWLATGAITLLVWLVRGIITAFVGIAWTLAYQNLSEN